MQNHRKIAVITGVSKGLGLAMVEPFIQAGWLVAGCARSSAIIESHRRAYSQEHDFQTVDVACADEVAKWAALVYERYGAPDLVINNAAIVNQNNPVWTIPANEFASVLNVNVLGTVHVIRSFVPQMMANGSGVIVNISSYWGRHGEAELAPYCASKFAIEGLTQSLAKELPPPLAAVALDPGGSIDTSMLRSCAPDEVEHAPTPEAWAKVAVPYLISLGPSDNGKSLTCPKPERL